MLYYFFIFVFSFFGVGFASEIQLTKESPIQTVHNLEFRYIGNDAKVSVEPISIVQTLAPSRSSTFQVKSQNGSGFFLIGFLAPDSQVSIATADLGFGLDWHLRATTVFSTRAYAIVKLGDSGQFQLFAVPSLSLSHQPTFCDLWGTGVTIVRAPWNALKPDDQILIETQLTTIINRYRAFGFRAPNLRRQWLWSLGSLFGCGRFELNLVNAVDSRAPQYSNILGMYRQSSYGVYATDGLSDARSLFETYIHEIFHAIQNAYRPTKRGELWLEEGLAVLAQNSMQNPFGRIERSQDYAVRVLDIGLTVSGDLLEYQSQDFFADLIGRQLAEYSKNRFAFTHEMMVFGLDSATGLNRFLNRYGTNLTTAHQRYALEKLKQAYTTNTIPTLFSGDIKQCPAQGQLAFGFAFDEVGRLASKLVMCDQLATAQINVTSNIKTVFLSESFEVTTQEKAKSVLFSTSNTISNQLETVYITTK